MSNLKVGWAFVNITNKGEVPCNIRKVGKKTSIVEIPKLNPTSPLSSDHFDTHDVPNDCLKMDKSINEQS